LGAGDGIRLVVGVDGPDAEIAGLEDMLAVQRATAPAQQCEGRDMLYSSGTTGTPKGVKPGPIGDPYGTLDPTTVSLQKNYWLSSESVFLAATPLYHVASLASVLTSHRFGGAVVVMDRFDAVVFLETVQKHRVTHTMVVPTILKRLLELPREIRDSYDLSSLEFVGHGGAPCPISVKREALEWLGPIVYDCWGATERPGLTMISPQEWVAKPGSIGRPISGRAHILAADERELAPGEIGLIYWEGNEPFEYHNDPEKTAQSRDHRGWTTVGDMGFIDDDGYLFLTDRAAHMIISGGENVYPVEIENTLNEHPAVRDAAVVGRPDPDFGQRVTAFVEVREGYRPGGELADEIIQFCRDRLAGYKCPRTVEFRDALPRTPTGKLVKRELV
jgi:long-chain acyl-CoA synthetase